MMSYGCSVKSRRNLIQTWLLCAALLQALNSGAQPVTTIAAGHAHSLFLKSDGSLWAMGWNTSGQLGDGTYNETNRPEQILASNVTAIAAGWAHSLFLKRNGSLWAMGYNNYGQLGDGRFGWGVQTNQPEQIVAGNVTAIAIGSGYTLGVLSYMPFSQSLFLKSDGSLWGMGYNGYCQLGDVTYPNYYTNRPVQIVGSNVTAIAAGGWHSLFLKSDGSLWGMGYNGYGQLGDRTYNTYYTNSPEQIVGSNVTAIAAGGWHSLFLKSDGSMWAMGDNEWGQLGDGTSRLGVQTNRPEQIVASNVMAMAAGFSHSLFLKNNGSLWAMGNNNYGQLGDGTWNSTNQPEQIVASGVTAIAAGHSHSLFLKSDGSLWGMGYNEGGQLGDGTYSNTNRPEQILAAYNQISGQLVDGTNMQLSFVGIANANYALDRSSNLSPPNWIPQLTNAASSFGPLVFSNTPDATVNNYWRIRSVP